MIGPSDTSAWTGRYASPVSADAGSVQLREGTRIRRVSLAGRSVWDRDSGQWTCRSYPLSVNTTVTIGRVEHHHSCQETIGVEATADGRNLPLPSFETLLRDEQGWTHQAFNDARYQLGRGAWDPRDYAISGAFVGPGCVTVLVTWHATSLSGSPPCCYRILRVTPGSEGWKVEPIWGDVLEHARAVLIPFRDRFLVFDGKSTLWFDAQGNLVERAPWPYSGYWSGYAQCDLGVLLVSFIDRDERESIGCSDPLTGPPLGKFSGSPFGGSTAPYVRIGPEGRQ